MSTGYFAIHATDKPGLRAVRDSLRTLLVVSAPDRAAVERFLADDPYSRGALFERVDLRAWRWGLGLPASPDTAPQAGS